MIRLTLVCDECGQELGSYRNSRWSPLYVRLYAKGNGWRHEYYELDFCPDCVAKLESEWPDEPVLTGKGE